ncbi:MAG: ROK family protein [Candidatus Caenarcaniphilales bacterium]|nr:ROK family protein [Candidatus Caenarcaniphilales bacterium]
MQQRVIGVDIGATKIAAGIVNSNTEVLETVTVPTLSQESEEVVLGQLFEAIEKLNCDLSMIEGIGVCAAGPLKDGIIINPPNIPSWRNVPLKKILHERYKTLVEVENDANAAGYAELVFGAARGYSSFIFVTVSTGVGTGIIINKKIYLGKNGLAGEGGHVTIDYKGEKHPGSGVPGCIEALASGTAIAKRIRAELSADPDKSPKIKELCKGDFSQITTHELRLALEHGDNYARTITEESGFLLGAWLGSLVSLFDPELLVIGGGVAHLGEPLFQKMRETMPKYTINPFAAEIPIVNAKLREYVGIYGAASLIFQEI